MQQQIEDYKARPPIDILIIMLLQRRDNALDAIEAFYKVTFAGAGAPGNVVQSRILSLYTDIRQVLIRNKVDVEEMRREIMRSPTSAIKQFDIINEYLDKIQVTKFDNRKNINMGMVEEHNANLSI